MSTKTIVTDGELGKLARKLHEVFTRVKNRALPIQNVLYGLQKIIEGNGPIAPANRSKGTYDVWKIIKIGGVNFQSLIHRIENGDELSRRAGNVMWQKQFTTLETEELIGLIVLTLEDLDFIEPPDFKELLNPDMLARWSMKNLDGYMLDICPAEVGPHLREQYRDQPTSEFLRVVMNPINDGNGAPTVFGLTSNHNHHLWLSVCDAYSKDDMTLESQFVFCIRKITKN